MSDVLQSFHPIVRKWFERRFGEPSPAQVLGWPAIAGGNDVLLCAPTGSGKTLAASSVRLIPKTANEKISISYADIAALAFSGRDTAAGKSWEAWVRKYWERKAAGEQGIALEPEALE